MAPTPTDTGCFPRKLKRQAGHEAATAVAVADASLETDKKPGLATTSMIMILMMMTLKHDMMPLLSGCCRCVTSWMTRDVNNVIKAYNVNLQNMMNSKIPNACLAFMMKHTYFRKVKSVSITPFKAINNIDDLKHVQELKKSGGSLLHRKVYTSFFFVAQLDVIALGT